MASFEELRVFKMSEQLADQVWDVVVRWDGFAKRTVGEQLARASDSIGANIAEGDGRGTYIDNRRFIRIARGSLNETRYFLRRAFRRGLLSKDQTDHFRPLLKELAPALNAYLKSIGPRSTKPPATDQAPPVPSA
jgi:four helix bundle protein